MTPPREALDQASDVCRLSKRWGVDPTVMLKVITASIDFSKAAGVPVFITSGYRTKAEQDELRREGRPAAADRLSTHRSCPATGVDISLGPVKPNEKMIFLWGWNAQMVGLRWGGGSPTDQAGLPVDWQHVDMGPRSTFMEG